MDIGHQKQIKNHLLREAVKNHQQLSTDLFTQLSNGQARQKITETFAIATELEWLRQKPGNLIKTIHVDKFDEGTEKKLVKAKLFNGLACPFNAIVAESEPITGEMNLAVVMGIFLGVDYTLNHAHSSPLVYNSGCCKLIKRIHLQPFTQDVLIKVTTTGKLPDIPITVVQSDITIPLIEKAGAQANFISSLSYFELGNGVVNNSRNVMVVREIASPGAEQPLREYHENFKQEYWLRLPKGYTELLYAAYLIGSAFTSNDILGFDHSNANQSAFALLDLRSPVYQLDDWIIFNPLSGENKFPPGGLMIDVNLEVYEIINLDPGTL